MCLHAGRPPFFSRLWVKVPEKRLPRENTSHRESVQQCRMPEASGTVVYGEEPRSTYAFAYGGRRNVMVSYSGSADKIKVRITYPDDMQYIYPMKLGGRADVSSDRRGRFLYD